MGKKSRQKNQRHGQTAQKQKKQVQPVQTSSSAFGQHLSQIEGNKPVQQTAQSQTIAAPVVRDAMSDHDAVRNDIRRILTLLCISVALLIVAVIVNAHTTYLRDAGAAVARFLQL
jgi:hypothetical protein